VEQAARDLEASATTTASPSAPATASARPPPPPQPRCGSSATHRNSRVITTAPTWAQVEQLLWREIRAVAVARANGGRHHVAFPTPSATKLELGDQWFAIGLSTNEPERFQGHHADHMLLIVDEASGVDERIFEAAEGFLTAEGAKVLLIGNPTQLGGQFHRAFTTERARWHGIHISVFDSPNYTGEPVSPHVARALPHAEWAARSRRRGARLADVPGPRARRVPDVGGRHGHRAAPRRGRPGTPPRRPYPAALEASSSPATSRASAATRRSSARAARPASGSRDLQRQGDDRDRRLDHRAWRELRDESGADITRSSSTTTASAAASPTSCARRATRSSRSTAAPARRRRLPQPPVRAWFRMARRLAELDLDEDDQLAADLTAPKYRLDSDGRASSSARTRPRSASAAPRTAATWRSSRSSRRSPSRCPTTRTTGARVVAGRARRLRGDGAERLVADRGSPRRPDVT
jgi:hypothetical protein